MMKMGRKNLSVSTQGHQIDLCNSFVRVMAHKKKHQPSGTKSNRSKVRKITLVGRKQICIRGINAPPAEMIHQLIKHR